ncbi:hypothetical protein [Pseudomonas sp. MF6768]|uniref:hypothetical protein n=1 Tax=Pseudomonas sp. MF6768 TaxID=2797532 RepID=UPI0018E72EF4|nr:hypothetical protein [Pseudomonas sp. MF6768]MBJ2240624.1 hypothetical protein [Pseudomonas sp. MF6768]
MNTEMNVDYAARRNTLANELGFMTEDQVALLAMVKQTTVEDWRKRGNGPSYTRFGSAYFYDINDVRDHLKSLTKQKSREAILRSI